MPETDFTPEYFCRKHPNGAVHRMLPHEIEQLGNAKRFLQRAVDLSEQLESSQERVVELEARLRAAINTDPEHVSRVEGRAVQAEKLLQEMLLAIEVAKMGDLDIPPGWVERVRAQVGLVKDLGDYGRSETVRGMVPTQVTFDEAIAAKTNAMFDSILRQSSGSPMAFLKAAEREQLARQGATLPDGTPLKNGDTITFSDSFTIK